MNEQNTHQVKPQMGNKYLYCKVCKKYLMDKEQALEFKKNNQFKEYKKFIEAQHIKNNHSEEIQ